MLLHVRSAAALFGHKELISRVSHFTVRCSSLTLEPYVCITLVLETSIKFAKNVRSFLGVQVQY